MKNFILLFCTLILMCSTQTIYAKSNSKNKTKRYTEYRISNKKTKKENKKTYHRYVEFYKNKSKVNNK